MLLMILALLSALVIMLLSGPRVLPVLRRLKLGQTIYELGPQTHMAKQGTPTMGGLMIAGACVLAALLFHGSPWNGYYDFGLALLLVALLNMAIGFADDYIKVIKKRNLGLTAKQKLVGQVVIGILFSLYCYFHPLVGSSVYLPFSTVEWNLGIFYIPLMVLLVIFMTNSSNLLDGADGLLSTCSSVGSGAFAICALVMGGALGSQLGAYGESMRQVSVFALALTGATLGFLKFNYYPAKVMMGDTGSMFIGGATVGMAMIMRQPFLLLFMAFPMIISSLSVIIQRFYFKATHGKRIFKMSPLHHHFELSGYNETQIVALYAVVTGVLSLIAVVGVIMPFIH